MYMKFNSQRDFGWTKDFRLQEIVWPEWRIALYDVFFSFSSFKSSILSQSREGIWKESSDLYSSPLQDPLVV